MLCLGPLHSHFRQREKHRNIFQFLEQTQLLREQKEQQQVRQQERVILCVWTLIVSLSDMRLRRIWRYRHFGAKGPFTPFTGLCPTRVSGIVTNENVSCV